MRGGDGERAELVVRELLARAPQVLRFRENALGDRDDLLAWLGHRHEPLAVAREHLDAELVLEGADLLRDAGLRGVQRLGRVGDVQSASHDLGQIAKLLQFHACLRGGYPCVRRAAGRLSLLPALDRNCITY